MQVKYTNCVICGKPLTGNQRVICGERKCKRLRERMLYAEEVAKKKEVIDGKVFWLPRKCPACGEMFRPRNQSQIFCGVSCRQKNQRESGSVINSIFAPPPRPDKNAAEQARENALRLEKERAEIAMKARELGMSYGKYVAMQEMKVRKV